MLPVNFPLPAPMFNHIMQFSSACDTHVYIPVSLGFCDAYVNQQLIVKWQNPRIENSCPFSIWSNSISTCYSKFHDACILSLLRIISTDVIWLYQTYIQSINSTKDLFAYPITMPFSPLIH